MNKSLIANEHLLKVHLTAVWSFSWIGS